MNWLHRRLARLLARPARRHLEGLGLLHSVKHKPALLWRPGNERVLVLAPHPDDEVIGCGGTIAQHVQQGGRVKVIYLTDGRQGGAPRTRREEAARAMQVLGVEDYVFFDAEDGRLDVARDVAPRLRTVLESFGPQLVYVPSFLEEHPDHAATSAALVQLAGELTGKAFDCCAYEVWTPLVPNVLVPIDEVADLKREALRQYASQLTGKDYLHSTFGLSAFRAAGLLGDAVRHAEAFLVVPIGEYVRLHSSFRRAAPKR